MTWEVRYTATAQNDLHDIFDYISDVLLVPETAEGLLNRLMCAAESLEFMPFRHRLLDYEPWSSMGWRIMPIENYVVIYMPDETQSIVTIMRVMYAGRDIEVQLQNE